MEVEMRAGCFVVCTQLGCGFFQEIKGGQEDRTLEHQRDLHPKWGYDQVSPILFKAIWAIVP